MLSIGKNLNHDDLGPIPANTLVVRTAPQIELLKHAVLCITHAGLNTALEALAQGVPMVAIPIGFDQPGAAARIAHHGVGEFMEVDDLTVEGLTKLIRKVLKDSSYRDRSQYFRRVIAETRGLDVAADVIERAFKVGVNSLLRSSGVKQSIAARADLTTLNTNNGTETATESTQEHVPDISERLRPDESDVLVRS